MPMIDAKGFECHANGEVIMNVRNITIARMYAEGKPEKDIRAYIQYHDAKGGE